MNTKSILFIILGLTALAAFALQQQQIRPSQNEKILSYIIDPKAEDLKLFAKDENQQPLASFQRVKEKLSKENKQLVFAMNGGMFKKDLSPQGLFIENGITKNEMDTLQNGYGNFYLQPNGVFYLKKDWQAGICTSEEFQKIKGVNYATQSGPMLLTNGEMHPKFNKGSKNVHIRNGVGLLPNGSLLFGISKEKINFHDFASFFLEQDCKDALYLDGFVSRVYLPSAGYEQMDGQFGVIIAEIAE